MPKLLLTDDRAIEISYAQWEKLVTVFYKLKPTQIVQVGGKEYRRDEIIGLEQPEPRPKFGDKAPLPGKKNTEKRPRSFTEVPPNMKDIPPMIQQMMDKGLNVDWYFNSKRKRKD